MSTFVCDTGTLAFAGSSILSLCTSNISIEVNVETETFRAVGTTGNWDYNIPANRSWSCSFDTVLDSAIGLDLYNTIHGGVALLTFNTVKGPAYSGNAVVTAASISAPVDDICTVSWTAIGSGPLVEA